MPGYVCDSCRVIQARDAKRRADADPASAGDAEPASDSDADPASNTDNDAPPAPWADDAPTVPAASLDEPIDPA